MLTALRAEVNCAVMNELLIGYARVSTNEQDLTAQQNALERLGVRSNLIYTDHGLTGTNRARPGLREALAACRSGDTLVVAKLDLPKTLTPSLANAVIDAALTATASPLRRQERWTEVNSVSARAVVSRMVLTATSCPSLMAPNRRHPDLHSSRTSDSSRCGAAVAGVYG